IQRGGGLLAAHARLETAEDMDPVLVAALVIRQNGEEGRRPAARERDRDRYENAGTGSDRRAVKSLWRHADDGQRYAVDVERASEDLCAAIELALPIRMAQHDRFGHAVDAIVFRAEQATDRRPKTEHREVAA